VRRGVESAPVGKPVVWWGLVAAAGLCLALASSSRPAAGANQEPAVSSIEYQGTIDETKNLAGSSDKWHFHVEWDFVYRVYPPLVTPTWRIESLKGTVSATLAPPNNSASCSGTLKDDPYLSSIKAQYTPGLESGKPNVVQVNGFAPTVLLSSSPQTPFGFCGNARNEVHIDAPFPQPHPDPLQAQIDYTVGSGPKTMPFNLNWNSNDQANERLVLTSTLAVNASALPTLPATPLPVRDAVVSALKGELAQALWPCLSAGSGLVLFGAAGPMGVIVGATLLAVATPVCAEAVTAIFNLQKTYRDPPVGSYTVAATITRLPPKTIPLPACPANGKLVQACKALHAAVLAWASTLQRVEESSNALAETVGRESAARRAGNAAAVSLQERTATQLLPALINDLKAQSTAGANLATTLRGVSGLLTATQSNTAINTILAKLERLGISRPELLSEAPQELKPQPTDLVATLGRSVTS
jgi:hypothetical protein